MWIVVACMVIAHGARDVCVDMPPGMAFERASECSKIADAIGPKGSYYGLCKPSSFEFQK